MHSHWHVRRSATAYFFTTGKTMHYHLGATKSELLREAPTKPLFDVVLIYSCEINCKSFNIGSGVGGGDDSHYRFKAGFSKKSPEYCVFMSVFNQNAYDGLVNQREKIACSSDGELVGSFLPRYRAPIVPKPISPKVDTQDKPVRECWSL